jgi:hypothetical protein
MAALLGASRAITYAAARAMDEDERKAAPLAAQAKLLACDMAVEVTQLGQLMHGGWGYAEEYPISRYVVDAQVLPIFEGVKPILGLKVVARSLLEAGGRQGAAPARAAPDDLAQKPQQGQQISAPAIEEPRIVSRYQASGAPAQSSPVSHSDQASAAEATLVA